MILIYIYICVYKAVKLSSFTIHASSYSGMSPSGLDLSEPKPFKMPGFSVIGHRGNGMNVLQSSDRRTRGFKENSILSFNSAAKFPIDFIEFDVQVGFFESSLKLWSVRLILGGLYFEIRIKILCRRIF